MRLAPVVGPHDQYMHFIAALTQMPGPMKGTFPLMDGGQNKQQPVNCIDVGEAIAASVGTTTSLGATYEIAGPTVYTLEELVHVAFKSFKTAPSTLTVPKAAISWLYCGGIGLRMPLINQDPQVTEDMADRLCMDVVKAEGSLGMEDLGLSPAPIEKHLMFMEQYIKGGARQTYLEVQ
jgi:hypothetical protein